MEDISNLPTVSNDDDWLDLREGGRCKVSGRLDGTLRSGQQTVVVTMPSWELLAIAVEAGYAGADLAAGTKVTIVARRTEDGLEARSDDIVADDAVRSKAPTIIGLTGKQESGKSTAALYLRERHGYAGTNLTDPFDEMLTPLMRRMKVPEHEILPRLTGSMKNAPIVGFEWLTGRKLKQAIGREFRDVISRPLDDGGTDRGFFHDLWRVENAHHPRLVHEQIRYGFEAALIQRDGGEVHKIYDPEAKDADAHESEIIDFPVDGEIANPKVGLHALHAALDAIVGSAPSAVVRHDGDDAPLAVFDAAIASMLDTHGEEIRAIADRLDADGGGLSEEVDDIVSDIKSHLGAEAANSASDDEAEYAIGAVESWVTDNVSNSTSDRRVAAVYAHLGAEEASRRLVGGKA